MNPLIQNYSNDKMSQLKKEGATVKMSFLAQQNDDTVICHACIRYATAFLSLSAARSQFSSQPSCSGSHCFLLCSYHIADIFEYVSQEACSHLSQSEVMKIMSSLNQI